MNKVELLSPAGSIVCVKSALRFGADAVYIGGTMLQLRAKNAAFSLEQIHAAAALTHSYGKRLYVTINALARNNELDGLRVYVNELKECGVDAVIVSDLGVLDTIHRACPSIDLHVSTQASCQNYASALVYYHLGAKRIVLAREMTLEEIRSLRSRIPDDLELEAFVHGAMCMAISGRCIISSALVGRSGNRGECAQPCRWNYHLMEETRPNQFFPIEEDGKTTAILSSRDLNCIDILDELSDAGVSSFKIEGRMKTEYYVSIVTNAYRHAIDQHLSPAVLRHELETISHRPYTIGFYHGELPSDHANRGTYIQDYSFCGTVLQCEKGTVTIEQRNRFAVGDVLEYISPTAIGSIPVSSITDEDDNPIQVANHVRQIVKIPTDARLQPGDMLRKKI
jgi:putative protease